MAEKHFYEQRDFTLDYLLPYFEKNIPNFENMSILEVGCAEAGFMDVMYDRKQRVVGIELEAGRVELAKAKNPNLNITVGDITDEKLVDKLGETFDLIVMRDVIEHVPDRDATLANLYRLLNDGGYLFITFPPRYSGFAGHQQNGKSILKMTPWLHLLPNFMIRGLGKMFKESDALINAVIQNYHDGLTIRSFEKFYKKYNFIPVVKDLFLFRPIFKQRFKLTPRTIPNIPLLREHLAFGCEYLLKKSK